MVGEPREPLAAVRLQGRSGLWTPVSWGQSLQGPGPLLNLQNWVVAQVDAGSCGDRPQGSPACRGHHDVATDEWPPRRPPRSTRTPLRWASSQTSVRSFDFWLVCRNRAEGGP